MFGWMAWTWPTGLFFICLFSAMGLITFIEIRYPGTSERKGAWDKSGMGVLLLLEGLTIGCDLKIRRSKQNLF